MILEEIKKYNIILASKSPRRKVLLDELGFEFSVLALDTDESYPYDLKKEQIAIYLAEKKIDAVDYPLGDKDIIISSDTIVLMGDRIINKPKNREDAVSILKTISGNMHEVISGVCIRSNSKKHSFFSATKVKFGRLEDEEIFYYVDKYKPYDKAGAYGIQEWIGYIGVEYIEGSYFNVMGLPVHKLYYELKSFLEH